MAIEISSSEIKDFVKCPAYYRWKNVVDISAPKYGEGITKSILIHTALEAHYRGDNVYRTMHEKFRSLFAQWELENSIVGSSPPLEEWVTYVLTLYDLYVEYYPSVADYPVASPGDVERKGRLKIGDNYLNYTIDLLTSNEIGPLLVDHKSPNSRYYSHDAWRFDFQTTAYAYVCWKELGWELPIRGQINVLKKLVHNATNLNKPSNYFERVPFMRTAKDFARFERQFEHICHQIEWMTSSQESFELTHPLSWGEQCTRYGPCEYLRLCESHEWDAPKGGYLATRERYEDI